jgi:hypothetical protein
VNDLTWYFTLKTFIFEPWNGILNYLFLRKYPPYELKSGACHDLACTLFAKSVVSGEKK